MGARRKMSSRIGSPRQNDLPRSPRRTSLTQSRYWTTYGRSRPRLARVASVRPRGLSALRRYAPPVSPLAIQPEGVDATELREDAGLAVVALDRVAPHGQMVGEPDEVERRGLVQERHALREELLALALVRLAVDLLQQLVELRIGVAREVERAAR